MAEIKSTSDAIDYMLLRYGKNVSNSTVARSDCLSWLQAAEQELWPIAPWSWRLKEDDFSFTAGIRTYTLTNEWADIVELYNHLGETIQKLPIRIFQRYYTVSAAVGVSGTPVRWGLYPRDSSGLIRFGIWPTPGVGETSGRIIREKRPAVLVDSNTNYSNFPQETRMLVVLKALKNMAQHEGKSALQQEIQQDLDRMLSSIVAKDRESLEGRL
jgi:hypothetical protein